MSGRRGGSGASDAKPHRKAKEDKENDKDDDKDTHFKSVVDKKEVDKSEVAAHLFVFTTGKAGMDAKQIEHQRKVSERGFGIRSLQHQHHCRIDDLQL